MDQKNEANKMFIIMASCPVYALLSFDRRQEMKVLIGSQKQKQGLFY